MSEDGKLTILDVKVKTTSGMLLDIEIQIAKTAQIKQRILFYESGLIHEQLKQGDDYKNIKRAISIVIADFIFLDHHFYADRFRFYSPQSETEFSNLMEIVTLELPKLPKVPDETKRWYWAKFLDTKNLRS